METREIVAREFEKLEKKAKKTASLGGKRPDSPKPAGKPVKV